MALSTCLPCLSNSTAQSVTVQTISAKSWSLEYSLFLNLMMPVTKSSLFCWLPVTDALVAEEITPACNVVSPLKLPLCCMHRLCHDLLYGKNYFPFHWVVVLWVMAKLSPSFCFTISSTILFFTCSPASVTVIFLAIPIIVSGWCITLRVLHLPNQNHWSENNQ